MSEKHPDAADENVIDRTDRIYDVLNHDRRRHILRSLLKHQTIALADLAEMLAEQEQEARLPDISENTVLRVYTSLHHNHLPKLDNADLIVYDEERELITFPSAEQRTHAETLLSVIESDSEVS